MRGFVFLLVMIGIGISTIPGCGSQHSVTKVTAPLDPRLARVLLVWRVSHRSLETALGQEGVRFRESHDEVLEQVVRMKHLTDSKASQHWERIARTYQDLYERANGRVSPRILRLRYHALEREVDRVLEVARQ